MDATSPSGAWDTALAQLGDAQAALETLRADEADAWAETMAEQRVHRALQRLRALAEELGEPGAPLCWTIPRRCGTTG